MSTEHYDFPIPDGGASAKVPRDLRLLAESIDSTLKTELDAMEAQAALFQTQLSNQKYYVNVKEFGAIGDGVTDDFPAIQGAYNSLANGGQLFFPPGNFKMSNKLSIDASKKISLLGSGFGVTTFDCTGVFATTEFTPMVASAVVTQSILKNSAVVSLSTTNNMLDGQLIVFQSTENFPETSFVNVKTHAAKILNISGNLVTIDRPFPVDFNTSGFVISVRCYKSSPISMKNFTVNSAVNGYVMEIKYCDQTEISVEITNKQKTYQGQLSPSGEIFGVRVWYSLDTVLEKCKFNFLTYGVLPTFASVNTTLRDSVAIRSRHISAPTGGSQNFKGVNLTCYGCYAGIDSHQSTLDTLYENCKSYGNEIADKLRGRQDTLINCYSSAGLEMRHDSALMAMTQKEGFTKNVINCVVDGDCIFPSTANVDINGLTINNGKLESFTSPAGDTFFVNNLKVYKSTGTAVWIPFHKQVSFKNVRLFGVYRGLPQTAGTESTTPNVAFLLDRAVGEKMVFENVTIDGFDVAMNMPNTLDCKRYKFSMVDFINTVTAFKASSTDKFLLTLDGSSFTGTKTKFDTTSKFVNLVNNEKF